MDAATIRDSSKWQPVNGAEIAVVAEGLKVELAQGTWGGATLTNVRLPADATGLKIGIASLRVGRWETRVSGVHTSRDQPAETSSFVGIQVAAGQQGPYPDATFRSDFDPRVVWKIRRGEVLPSISIIFSDALPGDALIVSTLVPE